MKIRKKHICLFFVVLIAFAVYLYLPSKAARDLIAPPAENGKVSKITWETQYGGVFFDDKGKIYRLSDSGLAIAQYNESGEFERKIKLKFNEHGWQGAGLSIAECENCFQITAVLGKKMPKQYEIDKEGNVIRELTERDRFYNKSLQPYGCVFSEREGSPQSPSDWYDTNKNRITVPYLSTLYPDGHGHYIAQFDEGGLLRMHSFGYPISAKYFPLIEKYPDEDRLCSYVIPFLAMFLDLPKWIKRPPSYTNWLKGLGFDGTGNFYAVTRNESADKKRYVVRINPKGSITGIIKVPEDLYVPSFLSDMSVKEMIRKGYSLDSTVGYRLMCNGTIYAYNIGPYSEAAHKRWIQYGEFYIYQFQFDNKFK